jgi:hypothetical protein
MMLPTDFTAVTFTAVANPSWFLLSRCPQKSLIRGIKQDVKKR